MTKKYELSGETKDFDGIQLHRIKALVDIPAWGVKAGDLGGWLQSETNLSHEGDAWVFGDARVFENALVCWDARVSGNAQVYGKARVFDNAQVFEGARVFGKAQVFRNAQVYGKAQVSENAWVSGDAWVFGKAQASGNAVVYGNAQVYGDARVYGNTRVYGEAVVRASVITKASDVVVVQMEPYKLTFTPGFITIGCRCKTTAKWLETTPQQAEDMGLGAKHYEFYKSTVEHFLNSRKDLF